MTVQANGKTKDPVLVVVQLSGGNDFMNTVIPFTEGIYYDNRPLVGIAAVSYTHLTLPTILLV